MGGQLPAQGGAVHPPRSLRGHSRWLAREKCSPCAPSKHLSSQSGTVQTSSAQGMCQEPRWPPSIMIRPGFRPGGPAVGMARACHTRSAPRLHGPVSQGLPRLCGPGTRDTQRWAPASASQLTGVVLRLQSENRCWRRRPGRPAGAKGLTTSVPSVRPSPGHCSVTAIVTTALVPTRRPVVFQFMLMRQTSSLILAP